ncbi:MAG: tRNA dihydrouridine synthase DusB [Deltaproteobacteria bacterium]|nr:tRNA dihydrouridine synthase DusB [Deltaproteobacteria bacterium]
MRIGPYKLKNPWVLAPMAGVSEMPFRVIAFEMGAALCPTELISAKGLIYGNERTQKYLKHDAATERPYAVQLFGGEPDVMARAAELAVAAGAQIIDINMGCPVKKVTKTGAGSALLCDTGRAQDVVRSIKRAVNVPVTCKIRAGWDSNAINCAEVAKALQDAGAAAIALHPRTRAQGYSGKADWSLISRLREVVTTATLIGNGDVTTKEAAHRMLRETGCDLVMIGRGALGNPWIFKELTDDAFVPPTGVERAALILRHLDDQIAFVGDEKRALREMRQHFIWYSRGIRNGKHFREQVVRLDARAELEAMIRTFFAGNAVEERGILDGDDVNYQTAFG